MASKEAVVQPYSVGRAPGVSRRNLLLGGASVVVGGLAANFLLQPPARVPFDKELAWAHLTKQVDFGPRVANTDGWEACRKYLVDTLTPLASRVEEQRFTRTVRGKKLRMANIIARFPAASRSASGKAILLCAHWDTRPTADQEFEPARQKVPIPGANDGASGVAVLLEAARLFKQTPPPVPVMIVLFDGEDYGYFEQGEMFYGSKHFAANLPADVPRRGILLDMVGDKDLRIPQEGHSVQAASEVVDEVYAVARDVGAGRYFPMEAGTPIEDDHLPLIDRGLKVIDLIDFNYGPNHGWWHTREDTPDKCSPTSLKTVGDVVTEWVYRKGKK